MFVLNNVIYTILDITDYIHTHDYKYMYTYIVNSLYFDMTLTHNHLLVDMLYIEYIPYMLYLIGFNIFNINKN